MQFVLQTGGTKAGFAYCSAGYCTSPIAAGKDYARAAGLTVAPDLRPELAGTPENAATIYSMVSDYFANGANSTWDISGSATPRRPRFFRPGARQARAQREDDRERLGHG